MLPHRNPDPYITQNGSPQALHIWELYVKVEHPYLSGGVSPL